MILNNPKYSFLFLHFSLLQYISLLLFLSILPFSSSFNISFVHHGSSIIYPLYPGISSTFLVFAEISDYKLSPSESNVFQSAMPSGSRFPSQYGNVCYIKVNLTMEQILKGEAVPDCRKNVIRTNYGINITNVSFPVYFPKPVNRIRISTFSYIRYTIFFIHIF